MYDITTELAKATQDDRLRYAAQAQLRAQARAARRAGNQGRPARRFAELRVHPVYRVLRVLRGRRAVQAY